jgi:hypothetical protein
MCWSVEGGVYTSGECVGVWRGVCTHLGNVLECGGVCTHLGNVLECGEVCVHLGNVLECATSLCSRINIPSLPH